MSQNNFTISQDYSYYPLKKQSLLPIQERDWNRIKSNIDKIHQHRSIFQNIFSVSVTLLGSAIFTLVTFKTSKDVPSWVFPLMWAFISGSLVYCIFFFFFESLQIKVISISKASIIDDMNMIEATLDKNLRELIVLDAKYGKNVKCIDVTNILNDKISNNKLSIPIENTLFPTDPAINEVKELVVTFSYNNQVTTITAPEHSVLHLP